MSQKVEALSSDHRTDPLTDIREPDSTILGPHMLTRGEKAALQDLLHAWKRMRHNKDGPDRVVDQGLEAKFYEKIFGEWSSQRRPARKPTETKRTWNDTTIQIGTFRETLPISRPKRKRGEEDINRNDPAERQAGAAAFLSVCLNYGDQTITYMWKDGKGSLVNPKFINFFSGITQNDAKTEALLNYDQAELYRVREFNTKLIVHHAQNRIFKWAKRTTEDNPVVDPEDTPQGILSLELAGDYLEEAYRDTNYIRNRYRRHEFPDPTSTM